MRGERMVRELLVLLHSSPFQRLVLVAANKHCHEVFLDCLSLVEERVRVENMIAVRVLIRFRYIEKASFEDLQNSSFSKIEFRGVGFIIQPQQGS